VVPPDNYREKSEDSTATSAGFSVGMWTGVRGSPAWDRTCLCLYRSQQDSPHLVHRALINTCIQVTF